MMKSALMLGLLFTGFSVEGWAFIERQKPSLEQILSEKGSRQMQSLKDHGPRVYQELKSIAFNEKKEMIIRWKAFMTMVKMGQEEAKPEWQQALRSRDWFMRDAAIQIAPAIDKKLAYEESLKALNDEALIVRSASVQTLKTLSDSRCADRLFAEIQAPRNFIKNHSLWIRRQIAETLAEMAPAGFEKNFKKLLEDGDLSVQRAAAIGLQRLSAQAH